MAASHKNLVGMLTSVLLELLSEFPMHSVNLRGDIACRTAAAML